MVFAYLEQGSALCKLEHQLLEPVERLAVRGEGRSGLSLVNEIKLKKFDRNPKLWVSFCRKVSPVTPSQNFNCPTMAMWNDWNGTQPHTVPHRLNKYVSTIYTLSYSTQSYKYCRKIFDREKYDCGNKTFESPCQEDPKNSQISK